MTLELNEVIIAGELADTPEMRTTATGMAVTTSSVLVTKEYIYKGEKRESKIYINVTAFGGVAEELQQTKKGTNVIVTGELAVRTSNEESKTKYSSPKYYVVVRTLAKADESVVDESALF